MTALPHDSNVTTLPESDGLVTRRRTLITFGSRPGVEPRPLPRAARWERRYALALVLLDAALVTAAVTLGVVVRFGQIPHMQRASEATALILAPTWIALLAISRAYERERVGSGTEQFKAIFEASVRMTALTAFFVYLTKSQVSRGFFLIALPVGFLALIAGRLAARAMLHRARRRGRCLHRVLAVGHVDDIDHLVTQLGRGDHHGLRVVGACTASNKTGHDPAEIVGGIRVLGAPSEARKVAAEVRADTVAVTSARVLGREGLRRLAWQLEGTDIALLLSPELTDVAGPRVNIRPVGGLPLLQVTEPKFSGAGRLAKGAFDRILAVLILLVISPVLLAIAIAIKLDSRGTVFFRQTRSGIGGQDFRLVKFRSMVPAAEKLLIDLTDKNESGGVLFKIRGDPRITSVGRILRRYSLDELPQLWNVVTGKMSLVGPRPPLPAEVERYGDDVRRRLLVKPGLTGLWQVSGRSDLTWEESVRLDLYYVENWSFVLDLTILLKTVGAVAAGRGAY